MSKLIRGVKLGCMGTLCIWAITQAAMALSIANSSNVDASYPATNLVDGSQSTFANTNGTVSYVTFDLGSVQTLSSVGFTGRDSGFLATDTGTFPGAGGSGDQFELQYSPSDNPTGSDFTTVAASAFTPTNSNAGGRLLISSPITTRYFRLIDSGSSSRAVQYAEVQANPDVVATSTTATTDISYPLGQIDDGNPATFANLTSASGSVAFDLGQKGLNGFQTVTLQARADSAGAFPALVSIAVSADGTNYTTVGTQSFAAGEVSAGEVESIQLPATETDRYMELNWSGGDVTSSTSGIQLAEVDIAAPEPSAEMGAVCAAALLLMSRPRRSTVQR